MKKIIRRFLHKRGYDIVKTDEFRNLLPDVSRDPAYSYFQTPTGNYYVPKDSTKDVISHAIRKGRIFEKEVVDVASEYITKDTIVLDVGANYGQMSVLFSRLVGDRGEVYSFEAQKKVFDVLLKNIGANNCTNVKPIFGAVYDKPDVELYFPEPDFVRFGAYGSYGIDPGATRGNKVRSMTIDGLEFSKPISFMKVDIQGSDIFALRGARKTIQKHRMPILFEFEQQFQKEFNTSFQDYVDFVQEIGYRFKSTILDINYLVVPK